MKKRILSLLLAGVLVLQSSVFVLAETDMTITSSETEIIEQTGGGVEIENDSLFSDGSSGESLSVELEEPVNELFTDAGENSETQGIFTDEETESAPEILSAGTTLYAKDIEWSNTDDTYWNSIDWTTVNWEGVDWSKIPDAKDPSNRVDWSKIDWSTIEWSIDEKWTVIGYLDVTKVNWSKVDWSAVDWSVFWNWSPGPNDPLWPNEDVFWGAVDWSVVDWRTVRWDFLDIDKVAKGNNGKGWESVDWSKVDWDVVYWEKIKELKDNNFINYTIEFPNRDANSNTITTVFIPQYQYFLIPSNEVKITVMNPAAGVGATHIVPSSAYIVYTDNSKQHVESIGDMYATPGNGCVDIFSASDKQILLKESLPALDDPTYWNIIVDDSKCTYALPQANRRPEVTIRSIDGNVELEEGIDFRIQLEEVPIPGTRCGVKRLRIFAIDTSTKVSKPEVAAGYISRNYRIRYANVADFYELQGIPAVLTYGDQYPELGANSNEWLQNVYLKERFNEMGALPKTQDASCMQLWSGNGFLTIEYQYEGVNWSKSFNWSDWISKHTSDTVKIRVGIDASGGDTYGKTQLTPRYLDGYIYGSFKVAPYSLTETDPGNMPPTKVLNNGWYYFAFVNPTETIDPNHKPSEAIRYTKVEEGIIQSVTYNGNEQTPLFDLAMYAYCTGWTLNLGDPGPFFYGRQTLPDRTYIWTDNVNAGKNASVEIRFESDKGDFTGSITRSFEILPKNIADIKTINVEAVDFVYDGKEHQPKLIIYDSEAGDTLQEGKDYTVKTVPQNPTNPGTINVTIEGTGNYTGTTTTTYEIINTSSGSGTTVIPTIGDGSRYDISVGAVTYNGKAQLPEITITNIVSGAKLTAGTDYKVEAAAGADNTNAGLGKVKITGITVSGSIERSFMIKAKPLDDTIQTEASDVTYNGKAQLPQVTVTDTVLKTQLVQETDFIVYAGAGADNINVGTGTAVIRGMGNYTGTKDVSFKIAEAYKDEDGNTHYADGSIQAPDGSYLKPGKVMISLAKATGNRAEIYLSGEARGARGYDYVIGTSADMLKTKKYYRVNKNQMNIFTNMHYVGKGTYYAACHAWARGADGKKMFGPWSELKEFQVTAVTPQTPRIIDTKVNGSTVTVTYSKCKNAAGYDVILGTSRKKVNGEMRPVNFGTLVKKVTNKNTLTVTFKNVQKGVYYAGLHAYSRTGPGKSKVFSPWSESKMITVN